MNAIQFLINEHQKVKRKFAEIEKECFANQKPMFNALCQELLVHEKMEQTLWYPHFKNKLNDIVKHLISEESKAEKSMKELGLATVQKKWEEKFLKFKQDVEDHASEEETKLFPKVVTILDKTILEMIRKEMQEFKIKYKPA